MKILEFVIIILLISYINSQVVCTLDDLVKEVWEDLLDNGKLDCLRSFQPVTGEENIDEIQLKRLKDAQWNGNCSFEAEGDEENDWRKFFVTDILKGGAFVDLNGNKAIPPYQDFDDQADMCEIVRAFVGNGKLSFGKNMDSISMSLIDALSCPGAEGQSQICAANTGSFAEKSKWVILIRGQSLRVNEFPVYELDNGQ